MSLEEQVMQAVVPADDLGCRRKSWFGACVSRVPQVGQESRPVHDAFSARFNNGTRRKLLILLVLPEGIELSTSPLPRECSTTELRQRETSP